MAKNMSLYDAEVRIIATALETRVRDLRRDIEADRARWGDEVAADPGSDEHWELDVIAGLLRRVHDTPELTETHGPIV